MLYDCQYSGRVTRFTSQFSWVNFWTQIRQKDVAYPKTCSTKPAKCNIIQNTLCNGYRCSTPKLFLWKEKVSRTHGFVRFPISKPGAPQIGIGSTAKLWRTFPDRYARHKVAIIVRLLVEYMAAWPSAEVKLVILLLFKLSPLWLQSSLRFSVALFCLGGRKSVNTLEICSRS